MLRSAALADERVKRFLDEKLVPVWLNVRTTPLPRFPFLGEVLINAHVDQNNKVIDPFSKGFFVRTVVVTPDGQTLLNPGPSSVLGFAAKTIFEGDMNYANADPGDFLAMVIKAHQRWVAAQAKRN